MLKKVITVEVTAVAVQQISAQSNLSMSMLKAQAQLQQTSAEMVQQASQSARGSNLDVTV